MSYSSVGVFTAVGGVVCVSVFTCVIFTVQSVTVGRRVFTQEETVAVSSDIVPGGTFFSLVCSNIGTLTHGSGHRFLFRNLGQRGHCTGAVHWTLGVGAKEAVDFGWSYLTAVWVAAVGACVRAGCAIPTAASYGH